MEASRCESLNTTMAFVVRSHPEGSQPDGADRGCRQSGPNWPRERAAA
jgi:hypothetical protein